jgi:hypothetical protein
MRTASPSRRRLVIPSGAGAFSYRQVHQSHAASMCEGHPSGATAPGKRIRLYTKTVEIELKSPEVLSLAWPEQFTPRGPKVSGKFRLDSTSFCPRLFPDLAVAGFLLVTPG